MLYSIGKQSAIQFQLRFTGSAQADAAAALALQMRPTAHQPAGHMLELRQLNLQLAFMGTRALGEDIENETGAIDYPALGQLLQIAFLDRRQGLVDKDQIRAQSALAFSELLGLTAAEKILWAGAFDAGG